jgi:hypothetical protein
MEIVHGEYILREKPEPTRWVDPQGRQPAAGFEPVVATVQKALALVTPTGQDEVINQIRERLELYKQEKPYILSQTSRQKHR